MLKDFELISHKFKNEITIIPLADLHFGSSSCNINEIKKVIKLIADTPNVYTVLCGDIIDNAIVSGKVATAVYDNIASPMDQIKKAVELLKPIANKILAVTSGNHEQRSNIVDLNPLYLICCELGIQDLYRDNMAIVRIELGAKQNNEGVGRRQTYTLLCHHGKGSDNNAIKKDKDFVMQFENIDGIITGHVHNGKIAKYVRYGISQKRTVYKKDVTVIVCNSFLNEAQYALRNMLVGASNEIIAFELKLGRKQILTHF